MRRLSTLAGFALASLISTTALASEPRNHDGFFMRLGLNVGPVSATETLELNGQEVEPPGGEASLSGMTLGFDLLLGGTVAPGLVIGGALQGMSTSDPTVSNDNTERDLDGTMIFAGLGVFANYYLDPAEGLYFQGLIGLGALDYVQEDGASGGDDPTGAYFGIGVGYDFWVGDEWSIGPFGRLLYANVSNEEGPAKVSYSYLYPSIGVGFTLH